MQEPPRFWPCSHFEMTIRHLALIPDGNRRWARSQGLTAVDGHAAGIRNVGLAAASAWSQGVEVCTFWWSSPSNLTRRAPEEVAGIVEVLRKFLEYDAPGLLVANQASFSIHGRWGEFCPELAPVVARLPSSGSRRLVCLMAYDGQDEILAAAARAGGDRQALEAALWTAGLPPVDLVLRTGGEPHLSAGFMLWWIANAQLAFTDTLWPALGPAELADAVARAGATPRRLGG